MKREETWKSKVPLNVKYYIGLTCLLNVEVIQFIYNIIECLFMNDKMFLFTYSIKNVEFFFYIP